MMRSPLLKTFVISTALWLSACSILPESTPQSRYNLPAAAMQPVGTQKNTTLYVATPQANRLINSNYILVQPTGTEIQVYRGAQWADNAPIMLRDRLVRALNDANLYNAVSTDAAINSPHALEGYLTHFEVQYQNGQPVVQLQLDAQLVRRENSTIVANKQFVVSQPATGTQIPEIISAYGLAGDSLSSMLLEWLASTKRTELTMPVQ